MAIGAVEGVAVADHTGAGVVASDGQGVAKAGRFRLWEGRGDAVGDDANPAHSQVFQAVQGGHREGAGLGQRRPIVSATQRQVFLVDGDFATIDVQAGQHHWVVVVMHLQHQVGGAGVAVEIVKLIGEGFGAVAAAIQGHELRVSLVEGVDITAIGKQLQGAVGTHDGSWRNRPGRYAVSTLYVIAQHAAAKNELALGGDTCGIVVDGFWHIVDHIDVQ